MDQLTITNKNDRRRGGTDITLPTVAIVLPFDPKMAPRPELEASLKTVLASVEKKLLADHSAEQAIPIIRQLQQKLRGLNFATLKRSIAVFVSTDVSTIQYLDFAVEEKIIVDHPFRVRDIVDCKSDSMDYLILLLSGRQSKMYCNQGEILRLIKSNSPQNIFAWLNEVPEKSGNFSDQQDRREVMLNKFLHHMDQGLAAVLKVYPFPVFVVGPERVTGHFASITHNDKNIAGYVHKNCMDIPEAELREALRPMLDNWREVRQQLLLRQIEKAAEAGKLVCGIREVTKAAGCKNSRLLLVERVLSSDGKEALEGFHSVNAVDEIAEKVLDNGGDIEKMDRGTMGKYGPVALIRYY